MKRSFIRDRVTVATLIPRSTIIPPLHRLYYYDGTPSAPLGMPVMMSAEGRGHMGGAATEEIAAPPWCVRTLRTKELGGVPAIISARDMVNTAPDEKVVIAYVSYLSSRLLGAGLRNMDYNPTRWP